MGGGLRQKSGGLFAGLALAVAPLKIEVLHWWTAGSESRALGTLKDAFEKAGGQWIDSPISGGGGDAARSVLNSRYVSGHPPSMAQVPMGPQLRAWAEEDVLLNLDSVAVPERWDDHLPKLISDMVKFKGHYVAAPVNVHRVNWMWVNPAALKKVGAKVPETWAEFNETAAKLRRAGVVPLAHGGQPWQDVTLFEAVVMGLGGPAFYRRAFVELDAATIESATMVKIFDEMRTLKGFVDKASPGRDWNLATAMVVRGEAAMQIMGDWVKGEFEAAGKKPGVDYLCAVSPGSRGAYSVNNDSFMMFKVYGDDKLKAQKLMATLIMGEKSQEDFSVVKGSVPARQGVSPARFDVCARQSMEDLKEADARGTAVPSLSAGLAASPAVSGAIFDVVTHHFNSDMTSQEAVKQLARAVRTTRDE